MNIKTTNIDGVELISVLFDTSFQIVFANLGAAIYKIKYYGKDMNLYPLDIKDFKKNTLFHGKTIGRLANRVKDSILNIDGKYYFLASNENRNTLHGGFFGLGTCYFKSYITKIDESHVQIKYQYLSYDLESGFPGNLNCIVLYDCFDDGRININYDCVCDKDSVLNLTNHTCYTLGETSIKPLVLKFNSSKYILVDKNDLTPIRYENICQTYDFSQGKLIIKDIENPILQKNKQFGYDEHFELIKDENNHIKIDLQSNNFHLTIISNQSGIQLYSDNMFEDVITNSIFKKRRGVCIECQDSLLESHLIKANTSYNRFINLKFSYKDKQNEYK